MTYGITNAGGGKSADLGTKSITANDTYLASDDGLDGYSEVTVNVPAPAPVLQSKIARQNGTVTADDGYDGLSSVDVGVGQIGQSYSCANKSGSAYSANDKVWLNYKQTTPQRTDDIAAGTTATQGFRGLYMSFDGSTVGVNGYATNNASKYTITSGSAPASATGFSWSYQAGEDYFIENTTTYVSGSSGSTALSFSNEAVNTLDYKYLGGGLYVDGSNVKELSSGTVVYALPQNYTARLAKKLADNKYVIVIFNANDLSVYYRCLVDNGVATLSSGLNVYSSSGNYYKFNGFTSDGKYLITGTIAAIVDIENWALASFSATFQAQTSGTLAYYNNIGDLLTYKGTDGYLHTYKYDTVSEDWTEVTELKVQTSGSCGIASYDGSILLYTTNMSSPNGNAVMQVAQNEGWVATQYGNINSDSLTGYAAEPISAGSTGNVIVGERVDGTAITATNNSSYAREDGEKVWLYANNGSYSIVDALGLTSNAFTGVCKEAIAIGASGAVQATIGGNLVVRWTRNFSTYGSPTVDDGARVVSNLTNGNYLYRQYASSLPTPATNVEFSYKFQVDRTYASGTSDGSGMCFYCTNSYGGSAGISITTPMQTQAAPLNINVGSRGFTLLASGAVPANAWIWVKGTITDTTIDAYYSFDGVTWNHALSTTGTSLLANFSNKTFMSVRSGNRYQDWGYYATVDLAQTWVKVDGNIAWQPYAPITE